MWNPGKTTILRNTLLAGGLLLVSACQTFEPPAAQSEGINYRSQRYEEISAMRDYRDCVDQAIVMDSQARLTASPAKYLASAKLIESCEAETGSGISQVGEEERMRNYALAVLNYARGGDMSKARQSLQTFEATFVGRDIYLRNGASFIDTVGVLVDRHEGSDFGRYSTLNVSRDLKDEMRRVSHWSAN